MDRIKIVIPSAGRHNQILTNIKDQILCVPKSEGGLYAEFHQCEIVTHPELKNLAAKRNWIIAKFGDVFMVDDDMASFERVYQTTDQRMTPEETHERIQWLWNLATQINAPLFGFSEDPNPNHYNPYKPIMMKGISGGGAYGILKSGKLKFNENLTAADSHFITLLNKYKNRYGLIDTRFCFRPKDTFKGNGGQSLKRTMESEKQDTMELRRLFGEAVQLKKPKKNAKQNHEYQRIIKWKW